MSDIENARDEAYLEISGINMQLEDMANQVKEMVEGNDLAACVSIFAGELKRVHGCSDDVADTLAVAIFKLAGLVW